MPENKKTNALLILQKDYEGVQNIAIQSFAQSALQESNITIAYTTDKPEELFKLAQESHTILADLPSGNLPLSADILGTIEKATPPDHIVSIVTAAPDTIRELVNERITETEILAPHKQSREHEVFDKNETKDAAQAANRNIRPNAQQVSEAKSAQITLEQNIARGADEN
jgi:hypothetical protein